MKLNIEQLANKLSKIELKVDAKKKYYFYVDDKDNTHIIKSELNPTEFLAKHNLKKSAIK
jgi:hypothetical protein